ncbi:hypothetical protein Tco_1037236 [Tanacetum coccineum]
MIQVKEMMQDNDLKNSKSKDKGSRSRSQSMNEQSHYKQDKTKTRQSINVKSHIFNVIGGCKAKTNQMGPITPRIYNRNQGKKGAKNLAADHFSRIENLELEELDKEAIRDSFPNKHLMAVQIKKPEKDLWYAYYANFLVSKVMHRDMTYHLRKKLFSDLKYHTGMDLTFFKSCPDELLRSCVFDKELQEILEHFHMGSARGYYGADITARKVFEAGFY